MKSARDWPTTRNPRARSAVCARRAHGLLRVTRGESDDGRDPLISGDASAMDAGQWTQTVGDPFCCTRRAPQRSSSGPRMEDGRARAVEWNMGRASGIVCWARSEAASPSRLEFLLYFSFLFFEFPFSNFKHTIWFPNWFVDFTGHVHKINIPL
jgi:hypothetical protein